MTKYRIEGPDHTSEDDLRLRFDTKAEALEYAKTLAEDDARDNNEPTSRFPNPPRHYVGPLAEWDNGEGATVRYHAPYDGQMCIRSTYRVVPAAENCAASKYDNTPILGDLLAVSLGFAPDDAIPYGEYEIDVRVKGRVLRSTNGTRLIELRYEGTGDTEAESRAAAS
jgi:hypothetical protein